MTRATTHDWLTTGYFVRRGPARSRAERAYEAWCQQQRQPWVVVTLRTVYAGVSYDLVWADPLPDTAQVRDYLDYLRTQYSQQKSAITYPGPVLGYFHRVRPTEAPQLVQEFLAFYQQMTTRPASDAGPVEAPAR